MATTPLVLLTLVAVVVALFILNAFFVWSVRSKLDDDDDDDGGKGPASSSSAAPSTLESCNDVLLPNDGNNESKVDHTSKDSDPSQQQQHHPISTPHKLLEFFFYGLLLDSVMQEHNHIYRFPGWAKKWISVLTTCFLVISSSLIMSPQFLMTDATTPLAKNTAPDFCDSVTKSDKMDTFRAQLEATTRRSLAKNQTDRMLALHEALQHDVSRYGEQGHECQSIGTMLGTKEDYQKQNMQESNGPFFPGYCQAALDESIRLARERQCKERVCAQVKDGIFKIRWAEKCVTVAVACPRQTDDEEATLNNYRATQMEIVNEKIQDKTGVDFSEEFTDAAEDAYGVASRLVTKLLHQVDVAGTVYIFYACLTIFFPSPVILNRSSIYSVVNRLLFGVNRWQFIIGVVAVWWCVEYFNFVWFNPNIRLYAANMLQDPCFVDGDFVMARRDALEDMCGEVLEYANTFQRYDVALDHLARQADLFVGTTECCDSYFPYLKLQDLAGGDTEALQALGFDRTPSFLANYGEYGSNCLLWNIDRQCVCVCVCVWKNLHPLLTDEPLRCTSLSSPSPSSYLIFLFHVPTHPHVPTKHHFFLRQHLVPTRSQLYVHRGDFHLHRARGSPTLHSRDQPRSQHQRLGPMDQDRPCSKPVDQGRVGQFRIGPLLARRSLVPLRRIV